MSDRKNYRLVYGETGEVRPPRKGEWFRGLRGGVVLARFDFTAQDFPILREELDEVKDE